MGDQKSFHHLATNPLKASGPGTASILCLQLCNCVFPVEPQSPNGKNINLHKKWGFRRFQKECQKVRKTALKTPLLHKKRGSPHFSALFLESAETPLFVQISVFAVWALRPHRKYTTLQTHGDYQVLLGSSLIESPRRLWLFLRSLSLTSAPKLKGRQQMGETGFCKNLRFSAVSYENLRFPAVFCANLRLPNPSIYRASRKSAKICKSVRSGSGFSLLLSPFRSDFDLWNAERNLRNSNSLLGS